MTQELLTLDQAAKLLRVTYKRAAELVREGVLPSVHLGRQIRIDPERLKAFIADGGKALPGGWKRRSTQPAE